MLKPAYLYRNELPDIYNRELSLSRAKYFHTCWFVFMKTEDLSFDMEHVEQWVSINEKTGTINGYLEASINRGTRMATNWAVFGFSDRNKEEFRKDMYDFTEHLLKTYRKIRIDVSIGNPAIESIEEHIGHFGGRLIGIAYKDTILRDGTICDHKMYEILSKTN